MNSHRKNRKSKIKPIKSYLDENMDKSDIESNLIKQQIDLLNAYINVLSERIELENRNSKDKA